MKVSLFTWEFPPNIYGGAGVHVAHLSEALRKQIDVEVRTVAVGAEPKTPGMQVRRYPASLGDASLARADPRLSKALATLAFNLRIVADPIDADIVHTHTWYTNFAGALAKRAYGAALVATVHSLEPLRPWKREQLGSGYEISSWMEKDGLTACDAVIAVSKEMKQDIRKCYDVPEDRIAVIHNGVDPGVFRPRDGRATVDKYRIPKPFILFVGRLTRQTGVFDLVRAMDRVPKGVTLALVTGKPDTLGIVDELRAALKERRNILWLNEFLMEKELVDLYNEAEVFVCPSAYEPFGIINLEAMACETPVVASRVGGITEVVVDGETGFLVPPAEPEVLAERLARILGDPELGQRLGKAGRQRVLQEFSWDRLAQRVLGLHRTLPQRPWGPPAPRIGKVFWQTPESNSCERTESAQVGESWMRIDSTGATSSSRARALASAAPSP